MPQPSGDVAVEIDEISSVHSSRRYRMTRDGGRTVRRRTASSTKYETRCSQEDSNYGTQNLNRRLGKLTKKIDAAGGITRLLDSHLKSVANNIGVDVEVYFKEIIWLFWIPLAGLIFILGFLVTPQLYVRFKGTGYEVNGNFTWYDIFTGTGWMNQTELYQGFYFAKSAYADYDMPTAYFLTILAAYFLYVVWIARSYTSNRSEKYVERDVRHKARKDRQDEKAVSIAATPKIFSMWDFSICRTATAKVRHNIIREEIIRFVNHRARVKEELEADKIQLFINITVNIILYILIAGLGAGIWFLSFSVDWNRLFVPVLTSLSSFLFPIIFNVFGIFERYLKRSSALTAGMLRQLFLQLVLFSSFVFYLISVTKCVNLPPGDPFEAICKVKLKGNWTINNSTCLENVIGQQLYGWQVLDVVVMVAFSLLVYGGWKLLSVCGVSKAPVVDVPQLVQHLMLTQSLSWFAMYFVPLMPIVMMVKLVLIFFWFRFLLTRTCRPSERPWKARKVMSFFLILIVLSFVMAFVAVIVYIVLVPPSKVCGPFRNLNSTLNAWPHAANQDVNSNIYLVLVFLDTLGFKIFITVVLIVLLLFFQRDAQQKYETTRMLRKSILMVTKDKVYYMKMLHHNARRNPYQMIKKLPVPVRVTRSPSDASIAIPPDEREDSSDERSVNQGISSHLMTSDASLPSQLSAEIVVEPQNSETQDPLGTAPMESQPETQEPETYPDVRDPAIEVLQTQEPDTPAFEAREPEIPTFEAQEPEIPTFEAREPEIPTFEAQDPETLAFEAQEPETLAFDATEPEIPAFEAQEPEIPTFEAREPEIPTFEAREPEIPTFEAQDPETLAFEAQESETPAFDATEPEIPAFEAQEPEIPTFEAREPEIPTFEAQDPETLAFEAQEPETLAFDATEPEIPAFEAQEPEIPTFEAREPEIPTFEAQEPEIPTPAFGAYGQEPSSPWPRASGPPEDSGNVYSTIDSPRDLSIRRQNMDRDPPSIEDLLSAIPPPDY